MKQSIDPLDHVGLIWFQVRQMEPKMRRVSRDDLFQCGFIGLLHACRHFRPAMKVKFSTYATRCIFGQMIRAFENLDFIPRGIRQSRKRTGEPCPEMMQFSAHGVDARKFTDRSPSPDADLERTDDRDGARALLSRLASRGKAEAKQARVIRARVFEGRKLRELAAAMHISRERVRQIEAAGLENLRRMCGVDPAKIRTSLRHFIDN
jgi:RNA polymerase sigma factor (sigma-70 family)